MVSRRATSPRQKPSSVRKSKVAATGMGSLMPVLSISKASKRPSAASLVTSCIKSSRRVQQMQPLDISTSFSSVRESVPALPTRAASIFTSLMSFTMTATRLPSRLDRTWLSSVVLPAPRKPDSTVTGSLLSNAFMAEIPVHQYKTAIGPGGFPTNGKRAGSGAGRHRQAPPDGRGLLPAPRRSLGFGAARGIAAHTW